MLVDRDTSTSRDNPLPASHDVLAHDSVLSKGTNSVNYITPATNLGSLIAGKNGQFSVVQRSQVPINPVGFTAGPGFIFNTQILATIPHNLPYIPAVVGFIYFNATTYSPLPYTGISGLTSAASFDTYRITADASNVYIYLDFLTANESSVNFAPNTNYSIVYYLLQQTPN